MSVTQPDPSLYWDGTQWLKWDGVQWSPAAAVQAPVEPVRSFPGHMIMVDWDGQTLTATGSNKMARKALVNDGDGQLVLDRSEIRSVEFKPAGRMSNGAVTIWTSRPQMPKVMLHFLRKHQPDFEALYADLSTA